MSVKNLQAGDKVILKGFTGIKLGVFEVAKATDKTVTLYKANGDKMIFSKKTGKQTNVEEGKEKYANSIMEDDGSYVAPTRGGKKKAAKKSTKKAQKEAEVDEDEEVEEDDIEDEVGEAPKKSKKPSKKAKKAEPEEEEAEDDDFEDEFEDEEA